LAAAEAQAIQGEVQEGAGSGHDRIKLKVEEVLWMASRGGAEVVGWQDRLGAFEVGMQFDAQLVSFDLLTPGFESQSTRDLGNFKVFGWESWEDRIAKWVYCGDDRNTVKVWVDGDVIHVR
jgi:guanine deaminase